MKIGIDVSFLAKDRRGMGRVTRALLDVMLSSPNHEYYFIMPFHRKDEPKISKMFSPRKIDFLQTDENSLRELDVVWYPWNRVDFYPSCKRVVSIYDVAPYRFSSKVKQDGFKDRVRLKRSCDSADLIITCSEFSKSEIMTFLDIPKDKIVVIPLGFDEQFKPSTGEGEASFLNFFSDGLPYVFFVGSVEKRKNLEVLLAGFDEAKKKYAIPHNLLIAGSSPKELAGKLGKGFLGNIKGLISKKKPDSLIYSYNKLEFKDSVKWLGEVSDTDLVNLYAFSSLFVFPSLYEGFGIPLLEAFASGVPALISDIPVFREIALDGAYFFDSRDKSDLAIKMARILTDSEIASKMKIRAFDRLKDFSWEKAAMRHIQALEGSL